MFKKLLKFLSKYEQKREEISISHLPLFIIDFIKYFKIILVSLLTYVFIIAPFCFHFAFTFSGSMNPDLYTNDICICSSLSYGLRKNNVPNLFTLFSIPGEKFFNKLLDKIPATIFKYKDPDMGDIVPFDSEIFHGIYTKRIIAKGGDTVQFKKGILFINNKPCPTLFKEQLTYIENNEEYTVDVYEEILPNGVKHLIAYTKENRSLDDTEIFKVPEDSYFVCGDNRCMSDDGRTLIGFVKNKDIRGRMVMIVFSNGNFRNINPITWIKTINWNRFPVWISYSKTNDIK